MKRGITYLASGGRSYLGELLTSFQSLQRHEPELPVTVFSRFYFNQLVAGGAFERQGVDFLELDNVVCNVRGAMLPEIKRLGRTGEVRILHHRTRAMKARKLLYSVTDWPTVREIGMKAVNRVRG
jgi:hypothetical protein